MPDPNTPDPHAPDPNQPGPIPPILPIEPGPPQEFPFTEPKHYPIHPDIPTQPIHEPLPERPIAITPS